MAVFESNSRSKRAWAFRAVQRFLADESGQTIVEFVLLLAISISVVALLKSSIRSITVKIWQNLAKRIAAPCHDAAACGPGDEFNL